MMKTKLALAAMIASLALAPASAKQTKPSKPKAGKVANAKASDKRAAAPVAKAKGKGKAAAAAATTATAVAAAAEKPAQAQSPAPAPASNEKRLDRRADALGMQYLTALLARRSGRRYRGRQVRRRRQPDHSRRRHARQKARLHRRVARQIPQDRHAPAVAAPAHRPGPPDQQAGNGPLAFDDPPIEWNPALYNIAGPLDFILHTDYAARAQRLRTMLRRLDNVPAYYEAARKPPSSRRRASTRSWRSRRRRVSSRCWPSSAGRRKSRSWTPTKKRCSRSACAEAGSAARAMSTG